MSQKQVFTAQVVANATVQTSTTPSASVTSEASASATSTKSYNDAYQKAQNIAQNIANSNAQNDANLITQSANLTQQVIQSSYIPLLPTGSTGTFLLNDSNGNTYDDPSLLSFNYNQVDGRSVSGNNSYRNIIVGGNLIPGDSFDRQGTKGITGFKGPYSLGTPNNRWNQIWLDGGTIFLNAGYGPANYAATTLDGALSYAPPPYPWPEGNYAFFFQDIVGSVNSEKEYVGQGGNGLIMGGGDLYFYTPTGTTAPDGGKTGAIIPIINKTLLPDYASTYGNYALPNYGLTVGGGISATRIDVNGGGVIIGTINGAANSISTTNFSATSANITNSVTASNYYALNSSGQATVSIKGTTVNVGNGGVVINGTSQTVTAGTVTAGTVTATSTITSAGTVTAATINGSTINALNSSGQATVSISGTAGAIIAQTVTAGTLTSSSGISTSGTITVTNSSGTSVASISNAGVVAGQSFNAASDHRIKERVTTLDDTFKVDYLNPVTYINKRTNKQDIGLIAHELQEHYPELVTGEKDGEEMQTVNYNGLVPILINEIKNIKNNIVKLEDRISELENRK